MEPPAYCRDGVTIVRTDYRPKRARKRKHSVEIIVPRIVSAKKPGPAVPTVGEAVTERKRPAQAATITNRFVTAPRKTSTRFGPVQEMTRRTPEARGRGRDAVPGAGAPGRVECRLVSTPALLAELWG